MYVVAIPRIYVFVFSVDVLFRGVVHLKGTFFCVCFPAWVKMLKWSVRAWAGVCVCVFFFYRESGSRCSQDPSAVFVVC